MRQSRPDRHPVGIWAPLLLAAAIVVADLREGPLFQFVGVLTAMPLLAAALTGPVGTAFVGLVVAAGGFFVGFHQVDVRGDEPDPDAAAQLVRVGFILAATVLGVAVARGRVRRAARFRRVASVADAAQSAIMRAIPPTVGPVECASVYLSATTEASIGGDLVEVLDTPFGARAVVGDVRGKGMDAVRLAGLVLGSFREVAWTTPELADVVQPLDRAVRRDAGPEDFVTAVLVEVAPDGTLTTVACGHPPPYLVDPSGGPAVETVVEPAPPLGMLSEPPPVRRCRLRPGQRLVLVTDGLLEARRPEGRLRRLVDRVLRRRPASFFPAEDALGQALAAGPLERGLARVVADVVAWTRDRINDDVAVLALQLRP